MMQRWNPLGDFDRVWGEMDRLLNDSFARPRSLPRSASDRRSICMIRAKSSSSRPCCRAPSEGYRAVGRAEYADDSGKFGYTLGEDEAKGATWYRREIGFGEFAETISLPVQVDSGRAEANFTDGILTLRIPKAEQARVRRIPVKPSHEVELPVSGE